MNSDLMIEAVNINTKGIVSKIKEKDNIIVTTSTNNTKLIDKGIYITIEFNDIMNNNINKYIISSLKKLFRHNKIKNNSSILIVGLGNEKSSADALGPLTIDNIIVTRHLEILGLTPQRVVSAIKPGVTGETGIETKDIITSVIDKIKPDLLLVIDSLKSTSLKRLNKTIQMTDTGIHPGSGVCNKRVALNKETLGIPVIAVGVPTVCDIKTIVDESVINKKNIKITNDLIVTPKEIDFIVDRLSNILSLSINKVIYDIKL